MLIFPAIDIREGRCVRLVEGRPDMETVYSDEPEAMARAWQEKGGRWLHVVDLDGAFAGRPRNMDVIKEIIASVKIPVQVGGGIRDLNVVEELLSIGVTRVILGTMAINNPELVSDACRQFGEAVVVGIDARDGKVAIEGWGVTSDRGTLEVAQEMMDRGVKRIIFTDIWRDGTLQGPNIAAIEEIARATGIKIIASGGVAKIQDLVAIKNLEPLGVEGVIIGKALYSGAFTMEEALSIAGPQTEV